MLCCLTPDHRKNAFEPLSTDLEALTNAPCLATFFFPGRGVTGINNKRDEPG
jgi:hypothetical protein